MPPALRPHRGQRRADDIVRADQIGADHRLGLGGGDFLDRTDQPVARIVDQHVDAAGGGHRFGQHGVGLIGVAHIQPEDRQPVM
jgi:hypothetical protein